jgi:hypothetical protein
MICICVFGVCVHARIKSGEGEVRCVLGHAKLGRPQKSPFVEYARMAETHRNTLITGTHS